MSRGLAGSTAGVAASRPLLCDETSECEGTQCSTTLKGAMPKGPPALQQRTSYVTFSMVMGRN